MFSRIKEEDHAQESEADAGNDVRSTIPSRIKWIQMDITQLEPLKVRGHVIVLTNQERSSKGEQMDDEEVVSSNHITIQESPVSEEEVETNEAPKAIEDEG